MAEQPWMKFYPRDWRGDQALRAVSLAARGLWMEMLAVMHEAKPYGHLVLGGQPVSNDVLARLAGTLSEEIGPLVAELQAAGVFSVTHKGVIYSRRMVKDKQKANKCRQKAKEQWAQAKEKKGENPAPYGSTDGSPPGANMPEARNQRESETGIDSDQTLKKGERHKPSGGACAPAEYAFVGRVIRLKPKDFERWKAAYWAVPDFIAELTLADDYYAENPPEKGWFFPVSRWLEKKHNEALEEQRREDKIFAGAI